LPMSVARYSSGTLTIGRIAYRREGGDGRAQCGRTDVIYDCLVNIAQSCVHIVAFTSHAVPRGAVRNVASFSPQYAAVCMQ